MASLLYSTTEQIMNDGPEPVKQMAGANSKQTSTGQLLYAVKIVITAVPETPATSAVYITGNFNNWNPQDEDFRLEKNKQGHFFIEIKIEDIAAFEFKFTRGDWSRGETDGAGNGLPNRRLAIPPDTLLNVSIAGWQDGFDQKQKPSTASANVSVIDPAFPIPQLGRTRRIWVYLPPDYASSTKKYPVLYMHDGQNLFDDATAFAGEWGVDKAMNALKAACIIAGIDNGDVRRMNEYNPNNTRKFGKGEGRQYLAFIADNLKPYIDKKYRTLAGKQHTWMAGSSMGGLISFYAGLYYPHIFGRLGIFSPSFYLAPQLKTQVKQLAEKVTHGDQRYYFYAGGAESKAMVRDVKAIAAAISSMASAETAIMISPEGVHNEATWGTEFPAFYEWISSTPNPETPNP